MSRETSASIGQWQNETFGQAATDPRRLLETRVRVYRALDVLLDVDLSTPRPNLSRAIRAAEELAELIELLVKDDNDPKATEECADIDIVLRGIDSFHGVERANEVDRKDGQEPRAPVGDDWRRTWAARGDEAVTISRTAIAQRISELRALRRGDHRGVGSQVLGEWVSTADMLEELLAEIDRLSAGRAP